MTRPTVLVADGRRLFAEALGRALCRAGDFALVGAHPTDGPDAMAAVLEFSPMVCVIDYWMPVTQAPSVIRTVRLRMPQQRFVVLSWLHGSREVEAACRAGATAFLPKSASMSRVVEAITTAVSTSVPPDLESGPPVSSSASVAASDAEYRVRTLLPRDVTILDLLGRGARADEVARHLSVTTATVRTYIQSILRKTRTHSQTEAVALARTAGLLWE